MAKVNTNHFVPGLPLFRGNSADFTFLKLFSVDQNFYTFSFSDISKFSPIDKVL